MIISIMFIAKYGFDIWLIFHSSSELLFWEALYFSLYVVPVIIFMNVCTNVCFNQFWFFTLNWPKMKTKQKKYFYGNFCIFLFVTKIKQHKWEEIPKHSLMIIMCMMWWWCSCCWCLVILLPDEWMKTSQRPNFLKYISHISSSCHEHPQKRA